jgi:ATP-dependent Clp endopeptidase proteolytic subunit ClpP
MADDKTPKSPELEAAELRKTIAEARKAELEAERAEHDLAEARHKFDRLAREHAEADAYDDDQHRRYYFNTSVSDGAVERLRKTLRMWSKLDPGCDIEIVVNSGGGSVFAGLDIGDLMQQMSDAGHRITVVVAGMAASMAGVILQFADHRVIGRNSYLHLHEVSTGAIGKASDLEDTAELAKRLTKQAAAVYARRATLTADEIYKRMRRRELWLDADEALELGFVDEIR